jgi:hypothetical protein
VAAEGVAVNQPLPSANVSIVLTVSVWLDELITSTDCDAGLPLGSAIKLKLVGEISAFVLAAPKTVSTTLTDCGELIAPVAVTVTLPKYWPGARLDGFARIFTTLAAENVAEPDKGEMVSQFAPDTVDAVAEKDNVPDPELETATNWPCATVEPDTA